MNIKRLILLSSLSLTLSCEPQLTTYEGRLKENIKKFLENLKSDPNYYDRYYNQDYFQPEDTIKTNKPMIYIPGKGFFDYDHPIHAKKENKPYPYASSCCSKSKSDVSVRGYYRKDGTYVRPYMRSAPNGTDRDNFSYKGNTNPYH
mgnify:CR=1 FL=1